MNESVCERLPFYTAPVLKLIGMQQLDMRKCRKSRTKESRGVVFGMFSILLYHISGAKKYYS